MSALAFLSPRLRPTAVALGLAAALATAGCGQPPAAAAASASPATATAPGPRLRLIGETVVPFATQFLGSTIGGLSGIDYDAAHDRYILLSDDRSTLGDARFYTARLRYTATALDPVQWIGMAALQTPAGQPFPSRLWPQDGLDVPDPEAVRWRPGSDQLLWTSEGDFGRGFGPQLRAARIDGAFARQYALPDDFTPPQSRRRGPRDNASLEGLAIAPDGRTAWLALEGPMRQDGPRATPAAGGAPVRITALDLDSGQALRQIAYQPDAVPRASPVPGGYTTNGVSEILADGPHHLLVLERSYTLGIGTSVRLYRIDTRAGSDTLALNRLAPGNHRVAPKTLVADLATLGLARLDNVEGLTWGPPLPGGARVLVFVSDDNFNPAQTTQIFAAEYLEP